MKLETTKSKTEYRTYEGGRRRMREFLIATAVIFLIVAMSACASSKGGSAKSWTGNYFRDPDRVWNAIELTLIDLDYEITKKNRPDGVLRAESNPSEDGTVIALAIDQVMRTEDQVNVYVKPSFGGDGGDGNPDLLKAAADTFMASLNSKLNR